MKFIDKLGLSISRRPYYLAVVLYLVVFEVFVGGGGGLVRYHDLSLRMILLAVYLLLFVFFISYHRSKVVIDSDTALVTFVLIWVCVSMLIGLINKNEIGYIIDDVKPMLYFFLYYPMRFTIDYYKISYKAIYSILLLASVIVSLIIITIYYNLTLVDLSELHLFVEDINNVFGDGTVWFRGDGKGIFFTGSVYLIVTNIFVFYFFTVRKLMLHEWLIFSLNVSTILISNTRGLIVMMLIGFFFIVVCRKVTLRIILFVFISSVCMVLVYSYLGFDRLNFESIMSDKSTDIRIESFYESMDLMDRSPILGSGFGTELEHKAGHQENSYLDIALEQGLIGLALYVAIFYKLLTGINVYRSSVYLAFAASTASLIIFSATNPYVNNPMGIILILLAMIYKKEGVRVRE